MKMHSSLFVASSLARVLGCLFVGFILQDLAAAQQPRFPIELMRKIGESCPENEILDLLDHPPIRKEIELSEGVFKEFQDLKKEAREEFGSLRNMNTKDDQEAQIEKIVEVLKRNGAVTQESLTPEQFERLIQIFVQSRKRLAAANGRIAERIGLQGQELEAFREELEGAMMEGMKVIGQKARDIYRNPANHNKDKRGEVEKLRAQYFADINKRIEDELLTTEQLQSLDALEGKEFKDLPKMFGGRGRRSGGGNRSGGPPNHSRDRQGRGTGKGNNTSGEKQGAPDDCECCRLGKSDGCNWLSTSM